MRFRWIAPGGLVATVLVLVSGQLGAVVIRMLSLYVTGLTVLVGTEMNAVLARMAEERKGIELVEPEGGADATTS